ncbi:serine hydrolase domain-containing protein [Nocardiopsis protaetiae]|uniref:serine hydrolase domain-containing protein n=1 Tax=Nocardiopsis protaetiae TaxID=3382270 RepID=UPI00387AC123
MRLPLALLLALSPAPPAEALDAMDARAMDTQAMDALAAAHAAALDIPGLAYAVVGPAGVEHALRTGVDGAGEPVDAGTAFLWGSVAKPVTATAAVVLAREGRLDLDAPVGDHLPAFAGRDITVRDLMTHTSGIPERAAFAVTDRYGSDAPDLDARVEHLAGVPATAPGGHEYSSANHLLLGAVVEEVTGDLHGHLREAVLEPAGMDGAFTDAEEAGAAGLAPGHRFLWGIPTAGAGEVDDEGVSYGYLGGTLDDLAAFARLQLDPEPPLLDAATLAGMREGAVPVPGSAQRYGLSWRETVLSGTEEPVVFHGGATPGYAAMVVVLPERGRAVVLLQNAYAVLADGEVQGLAFDLARLLAGAPVADPAAGRTAPAAAWGTTGAALALGAAAVRPGRGRRRIALGAVGALSAVAAAVLLSFMGPRASLLWAPDLALAAAAAGLLGAVLAVRGLAPPVRDAIRRGRGSRRPRRGSGR